VEAAIAACEEALRRRPDMPQVYLQLAYLERGRGRLDSAVAASRKAVALRPLDPETVSLHAVYLTEAGRPREALRLVEPLARAARPESTLNAFGMAQAGRGRTCSYFAQVRGCHDATVLVTRDRLPMAATRARGAFGAAELDTTAPTTASASSPPARPTRRRSRDGARGRPQPARLPTLFNLGTTLREAGRDEEAREVLQAYLHVAPVALEARDIARVRAWLGRREGP
jgi:tetratricopeptide (TPR) repeat protein